MLAAASTKEFWYATRGTGVVSLVLLTVSVAFGVAELIRFASPRWPRFVVAALHRNVSLVAIAFLAVHVATAVADSFAPIHLVDVLVPFVGTYRPLWLGLGTVAIDLFLALVVTSLLRERVGYRTWRVVHWLAYAMWPLALLHGLGTGSDTSARWAVAVNLACLGAVLAAVLVRVGWTRVVSAGRRATVALGSAALALGVVAWMLLEPMRPGWARKAGTPTALLASSRAGAAGAPPAAPAARIQLPFSSSVHGSIAQTTSGSGLAVVTIDGTLPGAANAQLHVRIEGAPVEGGGVEMQRGTVELGFAGAAPQYRGEVRTLDGTTVTAVVHAADGSAASITMQFSLDPSSSAVGGTVSARSGASDGN